MRVRASVLPDGVMAATGLIGLFAKGALIVGDASLAGAKFAVAKVKARVAQKDRDTGGAHQ
jgi:hypothetical protein